MCNLSKKENNIIFFLIFRIFRSDVCLGESRLQTPGRRPTHFTSFRNLDLLIF